MRLTLTPAAQCMARGSSSSGRRGLAPDPSLPPVQPLPTRAFAPTLRTTPARPDVAKARSGEFAPTRWAARRRRRPGVPTLLPPTVTPAVAAPIGPRQSRRCRRRARGRRPRRRPQPSLTGGVLRALLMSPSSRWWSSPRWPSRRCATTSARCRARANGAPPPAAPRDIRLRVRDAGAHAAHADAAVMDVRRWIALAVVSTPRPSPRKMRPKAPAAVARATDDEDASRLSHRSRCHR